MTAVQFRNPEERLSEALDATRAAVSGHKVTLRATVFVGTLLYFAAQTGSDPMAAWKDTLALAQEAFGTH